VNPGIPWGYLECLIEACLRGGGCEGLDIGTDVLAQVGEWTDEYIKGFARSDRPRWYAPTASDNRGHHANDDAWYILLRAVGQTDLEPTQKASTLAYFLDHGTPSIREAAVRAMADLGGPEAVTLLADRRDRETSPLVARAIVQVLDDLED
jgi:hypothetical protein